MSQLRHSLRRWASQVANWPIYPQGTRMCVPPRGGLFRCRLVELFVLTVSAGWEAGQICLVLELRLNTLNPPNAGAGVQ
jgi:hypothetical protein